jgi:signal transduction histidine kinase
MATLCAASIVIFSGGDFFALAMSLVVSHASALAVIAPIALVSRFVMKQNLRRFQFGHALLLAGAVAVAFAPGSMSPLTFLLFPFLAWAAFSFSMAFAQLELLGAAVLVFFLTSIGGGPFADSRGDWLDGDALLQLYVLTLSITTLLIAAARNERQQLEEEKSATARLLHDGFEQSSNGFALVQEQNGSFRLMEVNSAALVLLESSFTQAGTLTGDSPLERMFERLFSSNSDELTEYWDDDEHPIPATITVSRATNSTFGEIVLVSIVDLRPVRAAEAAITLQLQREQAVVQELKALNQRQDDFVASVTHELRTPVTAVVGFSEELESTALSDEQREYVTIIQRNSERLLSVIEDVLTFSKLDPHPSGDATVGVDLAQVLSSSLDDLRHSIRDKKLVITNDLGDEPVIVSAVANDLTRVVINLATNAVKFTPASGTITFSATSSSTDADEPQMVTLTMTDSGPGIAPEDLDKVFDRFYRSSRSTQHGVPGTGLGLSIVRDLVTGMHGTIDLDSDGTNGTVATLRLPARRADTAPLF